MGYLSERVSYIKGLMDGMNFDATTNEGKLLKAIVDVLDDMAISNEDLEDTADQITNAVDEIDDRLCDVEDIIYDDEEDDEDFVCPACGEPIDAEALGITGETESFICPACGEKIDLEWDDSEEDSED